MIAPAATNDSRRLMIRLGKVHSRLEGLAPHGDLMRRFTVRRLGKNADRINCYRADGTFYTGLVPELRTILEEDGYQVRVEDLRKPPLRRKKWAICGVVPRPYQKSIAERLANDAVLLAKLPSAAGKSISALAGVAALGVDRAIYLTDKLDLAYQFEDVVRQHLDLRAGFVGAGRFEINSPIVVASVDSALSQIGDLEGFDLTIADEAHSAGAIGYFRLVEQLGSHYRLGLTATPTRSRHEEAILLRALFGPPYEPSRIDQLVTGGFIVQPRFRQIRVRARSLDLTFPWKELEEAMMACPERNEAIVSEALRHSLAGEKVLVLVRLVRHGQLLKDLFLQRGRNALLLTGAVPAPVRKRTITDFRGTSGEIMIGTEVLGVGVDMPELSTLVLACGQHAEVPTLQRVGRLMRVPSDPERRLKLVIDFDDMALHPTLGRHSQIRKKWMQELLGMKELV